MASLFTFVYDIRYIQSHFFSISNLFYSNKENLCNAIGKKNFKPTTSGFLSPLKSISSLFQLTISFFYTIFFIWNIILNQHLIYL